MCGMFAYWQVLDYYFLEEVGRIADSSQRKRASFREYSDQRKKVPTVPVLCCVSIRIVWCCVVQLAAISC